MAYLETRELKAENEVLRQENAGLKSQLARLSQKKPHEQDSPQSDSSLSASEVSDSQADTEHSADNSRSTKDLTSKSARSNPRSRREHDSRAKVSTQVAKETSRLEKERADEALFSLDLPTPKRRSTSKSVKSDLSRYDGNKNPRRQSNTSKQRVKRVVVGDVSGPVENTEQSKTDMTLLSVIDVSH